MKVLARWFFGVSLALFPFSGQGQHIKIGGEIRNPSGEPLPLATIIVLPDSVAVSADAEGVFRVRVPRGDKTLRISYTGFDALTVPVSAQRDTIADFVLYPRTDLLAEVVVDAQRYSGSDIVRSFATGKHVLTQNDFSGLPALLGEPDPVKAMRLMPGASSGVEGSSDTFVRGGAADQNLVLLDGAPLYSSGGFLGFLSVINPDVVDHVSMINGGFPAEFGGRLSSVLDVGTLSRIADRTRVSLDAGVISSRIKIEQPIVRDKAGFWIAGRASHVDYLSRSMGDEIPYSFYDFNGKLMFHPSSRDRIEISQYGAEDFLDFYRDSDNNGRGMHTRFHSNSGSQTFKWRHRTSQGWENEVSMFRTLFDYRTENAYSSEYRVSAHSKIEDYGARLSVRKDSVGRMGAFNAGVEWTMHQISPRVLNSEGTISNLVAGGATLGRILHEFAAYAQQDWVLSPRLAVSTGIRGSMAYGGDCHYVFAEPRLAARLQTGRHSALKFSYSRMVQYIHRISNSALSTPIDVWFPASATAPPQRSDQFALAWQRFLADDDIFFSVESYYKPMNDLVAFSEGTNFLYRSDISSRLINGEGKAYGLEFLLRKEAGNFTGWISYTLSWSLRRFDGLNDGAWFHARYDRRHNGAVVAQHRLGRRWAASLLWEFISGARFTPVVGRYAAIAPNGARLDLIPVYPGLNSVKLADAHRLDLGIKFFSDPDQKVRWNVFAGVYNVYNRATPFGVVIERNEVDNALEYTQPGLFGLLPFLSLGIAW